MMWIVKVYEGGKWRPYGQQSSDFHRLWKICEKFAENGTKARVERCETSKIRFPEDDGNA